MSVGVADYQAASIRAQHADLIQGLIQLKPKKRAPRATWVIFGGCAYFVVALLGDHSVREALFSPKGEGRAPQYVATAPAAPQRAPIQAQAQAQAQAQPAVVTFAPFSVPAMDPPATDAPLPRTKAHHTAPTHRAHSKHGR